MIARRYTRRLHIALAVIGLAWVAAAVYMFSGVANAAFLSNIAPDPSSSGPAGATHVFFLRKATQAGENPIANIDMFYNTSVAWNSQHIEINPGGNLDADPDARVCNAYDGNMTVNQKRQFIKVEVEPENGATQTYYIPYERVCVQKAGNNSEGMVASNALFANYPMPPRPASVNGPTGMYKVSVRISYTDFNAVPYGTPAHPQGVRFKVVSSPSTQVKIGPTGGANFAFPIIGAWNPATNSQYETTVSIPFGMCVGGGPDKQVGIKDSDNFAMPNDAFGDRKVRFRVWDATAGAWQPYSQGFNGHRTDNDWYQADDGLPSNSIAYFLINMEEGHKYELRVKGLAPRNTIVLQLPGNVIAGDEDVCPGRWRMQGTSSPSREVAPGEQVTFTHTLKNVGRDTSDNVSSGVYWWNPASQTTTTQPGPSGNTTRTYASGASQSWNNSFIVPANATNGQQYCQVIKWRPKVNNDSTPTQYGSSAPACVTVVRNTDRHVTLTAYVNPGGDTETLTTANFSGGINVGTDFPSIANQATADGQWGYSEISQPVAPAHPSSVWNQEGYVGPPLYSYDYVCPSGWTPATSPTPTTCYGTAPVVGYTCPSGYTQSGNSCYIAFAPYPDPYGCLWGTRVGNTCYVYTSPTPVYGAQPTQPASPRTWYSYYCRFNSSYGGWTTSSTDYCPDYYVCPGNGGAGYGYGPAWVPCTSWVCTYATSPYDTKVYEPANKPNCEYRCPTSGERAWFDKNRNPPDTNGSGDRRCFVQPSFSLTCYWDNGVSRTVTVNSSGNYCDTTTSKPAGVIGAPVCATLSPARPTAWMPSNPQPGMIYNRNTGQVQQLVTWGWTLASDSDCNNVVGMPYMKVYGGDVRVGGGVGATSQTCTPSASAGIRTYNQGPGGNYAGSGTQFASFSTGFVNSFVSGQFNELSASPNIGTPPTRLTFANNAGGSGWGGGFGSGGPCYNYVERLPDDAQHITSARTEITGRGIGIGQKVVQHVKGDVYITGDIRYASGNWDNSVKIPLFQLVVEGNIYIDDDVHQLDGIYAAIPTNATNGNIYTCSFITGGGWPTAVVPSNTFLSASDNCKSQLVFNGAVAARNISFLRDCGSLIMSYSTERTPNGFQGGTDAQECGYDNHAAEVFNFTPEVWIRSSAGSGGSKYDSIVSLPPVL